MIKYFKLLRFLNSNAALSVVLFSLRMLFAFTIYLRDDSDMFFYLISSVGLVHLIKLGNLPRYQDLYNKGKDEELRKNVIVHILSEFILILYVFLMLGCNNIGYILAIIILVRHFSDYLGFYFLTRKKVELSRKVLIVLELAIIMMVFFDNTALEGLSERFSVMFYLPLIVYVLLKARGWRYLVIDGLSSLIFSYDILILGMLNSPNGMISNFAMISRALNAVPRLQSLFTEPYRLRDYTLKHLIKWNVYLNVIGVAGIFLISIVASILMNLGMTFTVLISTFYALQVISRSYKNSVVRLTQISYTVRATIFSFLIFCFLILIAINNNSMNIFLLAKISGTSIFILNYVYILRRRRGPEFS